MHAPAQFHPAGSKISKIAIVVALHVGLIAGVMNSKILVDAQPQAKPFRLFPDAPPVKPPEPKSEPLPVPTAPPPVITVPTTIIEQEPRQEPTITAERTDKVAQGAVTDNAGPGEVGGTPGGTGATVEPKPARVYNAALANADACALPSYPARSIREGNTGTVTLALLIGPDGKVSASRVQRSSGHPELDRAAVAALKLCTFKPATTNGVAESAWGRIAYVWTLD